MSFYGTAPQWVTAAVALGALYAAYQSIKNQQEIARKRAAMDFFIKTEMDRSTLEAHKSFTAAVGALQAHLEKGRELSEFANTDSYWAIRDYLNLHELMGVGINQGVFDDNVCFDFWSGELEKAYNQTRPLIEYIQRLPDWKNSYIELEKVNNRWSKERR
jgi:hypothetical protein